MFDRLIVWTIQGQLEKTVQPVQSFNTKREAVKAMMGQRKAKTAVFREAGTHHYIFTLAT